MEQGFLSPLTACPGFSIWEAVVVDWMHTVGLGVLQHFNGNAIWQLVQRMPGNNKDDRLAKLWLMIQAWYKEHKPKSRIDNLTFPMFRPSAQKSPKLKAKAGETKNLLPCLADFTAPWLTSTEDTVMHTTACVADAFLQLQHVVSLVPYQLLKAQELCTYISYFDAALSEKAGAEGKAEWACKPKYHMLQEPIRFGGDLGGPVDFWTHADEAWVGIAAQMASVAGGHNGLHVSGERLLNRFRMDWGK